jgi:hypothetical protein
MEREITTVGTDMAMLEINPLVVTKQGELRCLDAKVSFDSNASHPIPKTIAPEPIMEAMGVASTLDVLDSGNVFNQMFSLTVGWLNQEGFTKYYGSHPRENVIAAVFSPSSFGP